jgi:hypothetical protein
MSIKQLHKATLFTMALTLFLAPLIILASLGACQQPPAVTAAEVSTGLQISKSVCTELADGGLLPAEVAIACQFLDRSKDGGASTVRVVMSRRDWDALNGFDGGRR